jgi:peptidylprolyl isomerase
LLGQSASTTPKPVVHRTATTTAAKPAVKPCDIPPCGTLAASIPKVEGTPKGLFALKYIEISPGTGPEAFTRKWLTVHYTGYLPDGTKFDSSLDRGEPITFPYGAHQVITGWDTGFEGMKVGGKRRLFVPYQLAYGETGRPPTIPAKSELVFDVELLGVSDTPPPQPNKPTDAKPGQPATPATNGANPPPTTPPATPPAKPLADPTKPTATPPTTPPVTPPAATPAKP